MPSLGADRSPLRIVLCPPDFLPFREASQGKPVDATYVIQSQLAQRLSARANQLTILSTQSNTDIICATDIERPQVAPRSFSNRRWFSLAGKASWKAQQAVGIPYLNVFSNIRLYDAALQCLPGNDLVYERNSLYRTGIATASRKLGIPYVLYIEADEVLEFDIMGRPLMGLLRRRALHGIGHNLRAADHIVCVSEQLKQHLVRRWKAPAERIDVFSNVADTDKFRPDEVARAEIRAEFGLGDSPLVVFVGQFYQWHDVGTLLSAFAGLSAARPNARLLLVGDGDTRKRMAQQATNLGIGDRVHFTGSVPHGSVPRYLAAADVAVVPYPPLPVDVWLSPLKLFEYMACGLAIVASATGQVVEVIQNGHNGLTVAPGDSSTMGQAINRLLDDDVFRAQMGHQARHDAVTSHSWTLYIERLETLFRKIIDDAARHRTARGDRGYARL
jgi:glycosyltransferase involved in cell wall biosynthesis